MSIKHFLFLTLLYFFSLNAFSDIALEQQKIHFLIKSIENLNAMFIRNGVEYSSKQAASHLQMKYSRAQNSFFAPDKKQWTAELFIKKLASKSSITGSPYLIKYPNGKIEKAEIYLNKQLKKINEMSELDLKDQTENILPLQIFQTIWPPILDVNSVWDKWSQLYWPFFENGDWFKYFQKISDFKDYSKTLKIKPFTTDGCSSFPDGTVDEPRLWRDCCVEHDISYWMGGEKYLRILADDKLQSCIIEKLESVSVDTGTILQINELMVELMSLGVAIGGAPFVYSPWRWGYGWSYDIKYNSLSEEQLNSVKAELVSYAHSIKKSDTNLQK